VVVVVVVVVVQVYLQVGTWDADGGINVTKKHSDTALEAVDSLQNRTLTITTILVRDSFVEFINN